MSQTAFYPQFNKFCLEWATPVAGSVTTYGGPLRLNEPGFQMQLNLHKEALFEQLLLFDVAGGRKLHRYGGRKLHTATWELRDPSWSGPCTCGSIGCYYVTTSSRG
jgi:hypothetical protein